MKKEKKGVRQKFGDDFLRLNFVAVFAVAENYSR